MSMNWDLVPKSRATNSYDLLKDVIKAIREEPRRIYMRDWWIPEERLENQTDVVLKELSTSRFPACGTVGCIRGWMGLLVHNIGDRGIPSVAGTGTDLLPSAYSNISRQDTDNLFYGSAEYPFPDAKHGTVEYAEAVVENIEKYLAKWEERLKAHRIENPNVGV